MSALLEIKPGEVYASKGCVKLHLSCYLNFHANKVIDDLVAQHKDIESAMLFSDSQMVLIEANTTSVASLGRIGESVSRALVTWFNALDASEVEHFTWRPNPHLDAARSYSEASIYVGSEE